MAADVGFALDLEPKQAIAFLQSKKAFAKHLDEPALRDSARARAARIANLSCLEMTTNIYDSMAQSKLNKQPYSAWVKEVMQMFERKGWLVSYDKERKEPIITDPSTGEVFGAPRRLETIYRTNMQAAFAAQEYQQLMDNIDDRPYWQYSAILDNRTRPTHASMHGLVFRYDDPFWTTFYPPNGFNCRCSVNALKQRDLDRKGLAVSDGSKHLQEVDVEYKKGVKSKTTGFKAADGTVLTADKGFDYNVGRRAYTPNLDLYPQPLAHQYAKIEMRGEGFKQVYHRLELSADAAFGAKKKAKKIKTPRAPESISREVQELLRVEYKFAAGVIRDSDAELLGVESKTAWISDSTLIKQFNSRAGDRNFGFEDYWSLPDVIYHADNVLFDGSSITFFKKTQGESGLLAVVKTIKKTGENFVSSLRFGKLKDELAKDKNRVIR